LATVELPSEQLSGTGCNPEVLQYLCTQFAEVGPFAPLCLVGKQVLFTHIANEPLALIPSLLVLEKRTGHPPTVVDQKRAFAYDPGPIDAGDKLSSKTNPWGTFPQGGDAYRAFEELYHNSAINLGNYVWRQAAAQLVDPSYVPMRASHESAFASKYGKHRRATALVIATANILLNNGLSGHVNDYFHLAKALDLPTFLVGAGSEVKLSESAATEVRLQDFELDMLQEVASRAHGQPNIFFRGNFTNEVARRSGVSHSLSMGCPSLFLNPTPDLGTQIATKFSRLRERLLDGDRSLRVAFTVSSEALLEADEIATFRKMYMDLAIKYEDHIFVAQTAEDVHFVDELRSGGLASWRVASFDNITEWRNTLETRDLVIGARIHGTMMGIYAGVPAVVLSVDERQAEMAVEMKIPHVLKTDSGFTSAAALDHPFNLTALLALPSTHLDGNNFDLNRKAKARRYVATLKSLGLQASPTLHSLSMT
jgi:hypothetical protein